MATPHEKFKPVLTVPTPTVSFFYLRRLAACGGSHRFACIAITKTAEKDKYRMSFYLHKLKRGPFVAAVARAAAVGRLNSERKSQIMEAHHFNGWGHALMSSSGMLDAIMREVAPKPNVSAHLNFGSFDTERNTRAIRGGLLELEPRQVAAEAK
jgi:hypothetical protein